MWKNLIVRKRHWKIGLLVQICLPVALFALTQLTRDLSATTPEKIEDDTFYPVRTKQDILEYINIGNTLVPFVPKNNFTEDLMEKTRNCLGLRAERKYIFKIKTSTICLLKVCKLFANRLANYMTRKCYIFNLRI